MPERPTTVKLTLTEQQLVRTKELQLSHERFHTKAGELTFHSEGYNMRKQPPQWTPQMGPAGVPLFEIAHRVREIDL